MIGLKSGEISLRVAPVDQSDGEPQLLREAEAAESTEVEASQSRAAQASASRDDRTRDAGALLLEDDEQWREGRIPFRLRVGAIGHRDLADPAGLAAQVRDAFDAIAREFPSTATTRVCFTVFSSLAEGADRLVVDEARARLGDENIELHAVLPLSADEYARDFNGQASKQRFEQLLTSATMVTRTPPTADREEAYERAGRAVVDQSDVLIALWDGHGATGRGGTAETTRYARSRGIPVIVVPTSRTAEPNRAPRVVESPRELAAGLKPAARAYARIKEFNAGSLDAPAVKRRIDAEAARLNDAADGSSVHWQYERVAEWSLPRYARADMLAIKYQRRFYHAGGALYGLAALAVTAVAAQSESGVSEWFALIEVVLMLAVVVLYRLAHRLGFQDRWISYRSLAEAFRSALFVAMTGAHRRRDALASSVTTLEEPWFQRAFSEAWKQRMDPVANPGTHTSDRRRSIEAADMRRFVIVGWVDDQVAYHHHAVGRLSRVYKRLSNTILVLFGLTIVIGIIHSTRVVSSEDWRHLLVFLAVALPAFGAALTGIRDQRQFRLHAQRSNRTALRLSQLKRNVESQRTIRSVRTLVAQTQSIIEDETLDWSGVLEFQDLEMVI